MNFESRLWVLDTSILVAFFRFGRNETFLQSGLRRGIFLLPGVVLCELYAGAKSPADVRDLNSIRQSLTSRIIASEVSDWILAGRCLSRYSGIWGRIKPADHLADVLVSVTAVRFNAVLASDNLEHMNRWKRVLKRFRKNVEVRKPLD